MLPDNPVEGYAMVNINTLGIGVYDSTEGTTFQMRGIYSGNSSIIVALDAAENAISITLNVDQIIADLPQATTTQRGVGETATDVEAIGKASITTFLTPSNLAALGSSTTFAGLVELATSAETQAGVSATLAVTPAGLASVVGGLGFTVTWADAAARAGATPDFDGQFGVQLNADLAYISSGTAAGDFDTALLTLNSSNNQLDAQTTLNLNNFQFIFAGPGQLDFVDVDTIWSGGSITFAPANAVDFDWGAFTNLLIAGVQVPANSVLVTGFAGVPTSLLQTFFVSNANTQVYGLPTGAMARTTFATYAGQAITNPPTQAEVQALDNAVVIVSQRLAALITDLMATLKPNAV